MCVCVSKPAGCFGGPETAGLIKTTMRAGSAEAGMVKGITQPYSSHCECVSLCKLPADTKPVTAKALHATNKGHVHKCNSSAWTTIGYSGAKFLVGSRIFNEEGNNEL